MIAALAAALCLGLAAPALAQDAPSVDRAARHTSRPTARAILAMAGNFRVRFDMRETTSWRADYTPIDPATSGGNEVVRVIEDTGRLSASSTCWSSTMTAQPMVIKHWRQDWTYEPDKRARLCRRRASGGPRRSPRRAAAAPGRRPSGRSTTARATAATAAGRRPAACRAGAATGPGGRSPAATRSARPRYDRYLAINRHSPDPRRRLDPLAGQ